MKGILPPIFRSVVSEMFSADIEKTLVHGIIIAIQAIIAAGLLFSRTIKKLKR